MTYKLEPAEQEAFPKLVYETGTSPIGQYDIRRAREEKGLERELSDTCQR